MATTIIDQQIEELKRARRIAISHAVGVSNQKFVEGLIKLNNTNTVHSMTDRGVCFYCSVLHGRWIKGTCSHSTTYGRQLVMCRTFKVFHKEVFDSLFGEKYTLKYSDIFAICLERTEDFIGRY